MFKASKRFGEAKGPFTVWFFITLYFATLSAFAGSSGRTLPQDLTVFLVLNLLFNMVMNGGVLLLFLVVFLALWEKRRSLRDIFSSVGVKTEGFVKSVSWSIALFPLCLATGLITIILSYVLGPVPFLSAFPSNNGQFPLWYVYYIIVNSFFPVAVVEEAVGRGYMLDRLMPQHPSGIAKALPAILLNSILFTLWHLPSYLRVYEFPLPWVAALLAGNVFPLSFVLGIAYVRSRTRNIAGPVLIHFLLDSIPYILMLA
ncbi:MAG: lysostaphin resistance A-like protein [Candidatus Bathyarchaeia archaeon]